MFQFTKDIEIGIEVIDNEHRHLFDLLNEGLELLHNDFLTDKYDQVNHLIERLEDYAFEHFAHEEAYMEQICDPELITQRIQHNHFRDKVNQLSVADISEDEHQQEILENLINFVAKWLYGHIVGSDAMIGHLPPLEEWMVKANPCEFTEEYVTGIDLIDREHKELFRLSDKVYQMAKQGVSENDYEEIISILDELKKYSQEHFADEEEYMEKIGYAGLDAQKRAHQAFIAEIEDVNIEDIKNNTQEYFQSLTEFLVGWLINHILYMDKKIEPMKAM